VSTASKVEIQSRVSYLGNGFHHRASVTRFIHQTRLLGGVTADDVRVVADSDQQRHEHSAVLETVSLLQSQRRCGRQKTWRLQTTPQTQKMALAYSLRRSPIPRPRILACSHTAIHSHSLPCLMVSTSVSHGLLFIYRRRRDERLSWPSWLTHSGQFSVYP